VVGCDTGLGRDIWFSSRSLGTIDDWFPSSSEWTAPVEVTSGDQQLSLLSSVADNEGNIHAFWVQPPLLSSMAKRATIQYARWDGVRWTIPVNILFGLPEDLKQLGVKADSQNRLLLTWVDSKTGDIFLSWANSKYANKPSEWKSPQYIPSTSQTNSIPDILVDDSGRIVVAYAIPINEHRGMYFVESTDGGITWTQQLQIFDAAAAGWDIVDQPSISLTGDGRLHVLFRRYTLRGEQGNSLGLYYSQSGDGGVTWSVPAIASEHSVLWNEIYGYDQSIVHRLWQEYGQSTLLSFHQMSQDSGVTWSDPVIISSIDERPADLTAQTMDKAGNIHFMQLAGKENLTIVDQMWNGSRWVPQTPKDLYISDRGVPSAISASISSKGNLLVSVLVDYPYAVNELKGSILSVSKSLGLPKGIQTPSPVILAPAGSSISVTEEKMDVVQPSSQDPSVKNIEDAPSWFVKNRNVIGLLLVGTILLLIIFIFRPISRKQNDPKKTSQ
jgi:hypothetical protein